LSGAVPDADDTAGALLACGHWQSQGTDKHWRSQWQLAARMGVQWLLDLQNRDGGWPTFCRGWGKLPFDRSGADLTAHALRALHVWRDVQPRSIDRALRRGWSYLGKRQRADGSWVPLWFGNQDQPDEENPVYGTARVLLAYAELAASTTDAAQRGYRWLAAAQRADGSWGGGAARGGRVALDVPGGVEETALAVEALAANGRDPALQIPLSKGLQWLTEAVRADRHRESAPIGFYFAKLWYYEKLYPLIFVVAALGRAVHGLGTQPIQS
jgi:squalene-hopene/tetraprenyl-beta-curcumene cyclase